MRTGDDLAWAVFLGGRSERLLAGVRRHDRGRAPRCALLAGGAYDAATCGRHRPALPGLERRIRHPELVEGSGHWQDPAPECSVSLEARGLRPLPRGRGRARILEALRLACVTATRRRNQQSQTTTARRPRRGEDARNAYSWFEDARAHRDRALACRRSLRRRTEWPACADHDWEWASSHVSAGKKGPAAAMEAKAEVRAFRGRTGHQDPRVWSKRFVAFRSHVLVRAIRGPEVRPLTPPGGRGLGARHGGVGMKVLAAGRLLRKRGRGADRYAASYADTGIVGCSTVEEVRDNWRQYRPQTSHLRGSAMMQTRAACARAGAWASERRNTIFQRVAAPAGCLIPAANAESRARATPAPSGHRPPRR